MTVRLGSENTRWAGCDPDLFLFWSWSESVQVLILTVFGSGPDQCRKPTAAQTKTAHCHFCMYSAFIRWRYCFNSIMEVHIRRIRRMWSWSNIRLHRENLKAYKLAYKIKLLSQAKSESHTEQQVQVSDRQGSNQIPKQLPQFPDYRAHPNISHAQ